MRIHCYWGHPLDRVFEFRGEYSEWLHWVRSKYLLSADVLERLQGMREEEISSIQWSSLIPNQGCYGFVMIIESPALPTSMDSSLPTS